MALAQKQHPSLKAEAGLKPPGGCLVQPTVVFGIALKDRTHHILAEEALPNFGQED